MEKERPPKFYAGFIVFAVVIVLLLFAAAPMQHALGIYGLFLTELMLLVCALISVLIFKYDIRKVLPMKLPRLRQVFGVLFLWAGALFLGYFCIFITMVLFPEAMTGLSKALGDYLTDAPILVSLVISALMPAICEEALCRGFIQYSFGGIKYKWLIIVLVGVLFGIFHMSLLRFMPTMILGFALAYIMYETRNILLPMLFHFTNNAVSVAMTYALPPAADSVDAGLISSAALLYIGVILLLGVAVPWLFIAGSRLLKSKEENAQKQLSRRTILAAGLISAFCFIAGIGTAVFGTGVIMKDMTILNMSYTAIVDATSTQQEHPITIEKDGQYDLAFSARPQKGAEGTIQFRFTGEDGAVYLDATGSDLFGNKPLYLESGAYTLMIVYDYKNTEPADVALSFKIISLNY